MPNSIEVFMARQPIYDRNQRLVAYELLYRTGIGNAAGHVGPEESARSLIGSIVDIGLGSLAGHNLAFLNLDETILCTDAPFMLPRDQVVLEILETVSPTLANVEAVRRLRKAGYRIALDDFEISPHTKPFTPFASIFKLDVLALSGRLANQAKKAKSPRKLLLAEKVETRAQFEQCLNLGFDYFQGYFFSKPEIIHTSSIPSNKLSAIQIVAMLHQPDISIGDLEELVARDLALTHRLLKMVRSARFGLSGNVKSIRQAVMFLGLRTVGALVALLVMSSQSNKPQELMVMALTRAKACERLAELRGQQNRERYFTTGLLSVIDAVLGVKMELLLAQLPLSDEINDALLNRECETDLALTLQSVLMFEHGEWDRVLPDFELSQINLAYRDGVVYAAGTASPIQQRFAA